MLPLSAPGRLALILLSMLPAATLAQQADDTPLPVIDVPQSDDAAPLTDPPTHDDDAVLLPVIVVTGENLERDLHELGSSVQVLLAEDIESTAMDDVYDAFLRTANVNANTSKLGGFGGFVIRGISDTGVSDASVGSVAPLASILVDGVPLSIAGARAGPLDFWDIDTVEVLRGPQSTNQGQGALAGAILLNTRDPDETFNVRGRVRRGEYGNEQLAGAVGTPLGGGFAIRGAIQHSEADNAAWNLTRGEPANAQESNNARVKLGWSDVSEHAPSVLLSYTRADAFKGQGQLTGEPRDRQTVANDPETLESDSELLALRSRLHLSKRWSLELISGYGQTDLRSEDDYNTSAEPDGVIVNTNDDRSLTQELRLRFDALNLFGRDARGVIGLYGADLDTDSTLRVIDGNVTGGEPIDVYLDIDSDIDQQRRGWAAFGEMDWDVAQDWTLTLGLRVDQETLDFAYVSDSSLSILQDDDSLPGDLIADLIGGLIGPAVGLPADAEGAGRSKTTAVLPKLGLRWRITDELTMGVLAQRAFRAGGLSVNFVRGTFEAFDPEFTTTGELFVRAELWDRRLRLRGNVFYTDWREQQVAVQLSDDPNDAQTENAGRSRLYGAELELDTASLRGFRGFASLGYARTEFLEFDSSGGDFSGNEFPSAPRWQGGAGVLWEYGGYGPYLQVDANFIDGTFRRADNDPEQTSDAYTLLNGRAGWRFRHFELYVIGRNLADRFYVTQRAFGSFMAGEPRTLIGGIEFNWE
ncbi:MAG: TonB-dependent receptor [Sinimarinibacterium flocculans]|uniref:TonB-dependent receptor n=1 Tax=Sinimarinibacterium flocculans TaxID=985250 RepID=UPI003C66C89B